jgi:hypothetical protein
MMLDESQTGRAVRFRVSDARRLRHSLTHQYGLHFGVQHHCFAVAPRITINIHDVDLLCAAQASQR